MAEHLEELEPPVSPNQSLDQSRVSTITSSAFSLNHLSPIKLPPFDGKYEEWESFRDRFTSLIIDNNDLSDFARMHFLTSCLKDLLSVSKICRLPQTISSLRGIS